VLLLLYLRSGKRRHLMASLAIYAATLLTYEITIPFFLLFAALAWLYPERRSLLTSARISWPFAALAGAAVALNMGLRLFYQVAFSGSAADYAQAAAAGGPIARAYIPNLAPGAILETIAHQASAALPLSFQLAARGRWLFPSFSADLAAQPVFCLLLVAGYGAMAIVLSWQLWREVLACSHGFRLGLLVVLGSGLLILPNMLISLSPRYQAETSWGIGYLPVYLSYFGVALLLLALIYGLFRLAANAERSVAIALSSVITLALAAGVAYAGVVNQASLAPAVFLVAVIYSLFRLAASAERSVAVALPTVLTLALVAGMAYAGVVNHANNGIAVETGNVYVWYPRVAVAAAMQRGLFAGVPADSTVVIDGSEPAWDTQGVPPFFTGQAGVRVTSMVTVAKAVETMRATTPSSTSADGAATYPVPSQSDVYYLTYRSAWSGNGYAMLGRVRELTVAASGALSVQMEPVRLYMSAAPLSASTPSLLHGPHAPGLATTSPTELGIDPNEMAVVASGSDWSLFGSIPGGTVSWVP